MDLLYPDPEPPGYTSRSLDIDKTWHVIHFLLNDHPWEGQPPLFDAVLGGEPLTEEDLGYGPARFLGPAQVSATAEALQSITPEELWNRYDSSRVRRADIYWTDDSESKNYALENYQSLREFFLNTAKAREAMIVWLA